MNLLSQLSKIRAGYIPVNLGNKDIFIENMSIVFHLMASSERLIIEALDILKYCDSEYDKKLSKYYEAHLEEEKDHFLWISSDLEYESLKFTWDAAELAGSQYYLIKHVHPAALLGYMAVLECFPASIEVIDRLSEVHGEKLLRTMRYHAIHDQDHRKEILEMIEDAPPELKQWIYENAINTAHKIGAAQEKFGGKNA